MSKRIVLAMIGDIQEQLNFEAMKTAIMPVICAIARQGQGRPELVLLHDGNLLDLPDSDQMNPLFTLGDIRSIGSFWKIEWMMNDIVGSVLARFSAQICGPHVISLIDGPEDLNSLIHATDEVQEQLVPWFMHECANSFNDVGVNAVATQALWDRFNDKARHAEIADNVMGMIAKRLIGDIVGDMPDDIREQLVSAIMSDDGPAAQDKSANQGMHEMPSDFLGKRTLH
jgi:hypothetical protein